ncbi:hypothetical protein RGR602_CH03284 [Rhizobium gallicum bv. gallicum R602sp]|uniref:Uncharacterized protein n=1 Tax=Rhizobium gallicum bv. gallicum R602sp TaxID=1041138 RepID=A0A0B4X392_9HYPH|nr:hypothetical protein RGR602_CH03284 [Rhizobium gallicum bv. gallicum R602sp]
MHRRQTIARAVLVKMIAAVRHVVYAEPSWPWTTCFSGEPGAAWRGDRNGEVVNLSSGFFAAALPAAHGHPGIPDHKPARNSKHLKSCDSATLADFDRAERFIYLQ